jgi:hypothetical protein
MNLKNGKFRTRNYFLKLANEVAKQTGTNAHETFDIQALACAATL